MSQSDQEQAQRFSRRDVLRRAAVTGGALIWIAPAVQTLAPTAAAHSRPPATYTCCECRNGAINVEKQTGNGGLQCTTTLAGTTEASCRTYCANLGKSYYFHAGPNPFSCTSPTGPCGTH